MIEDVNAIKIALRLIGCKYVSSEILDDVRIRLTYKGRNYILYINDEYRIAFLEQIESIDVGDIGENEFSLLEDIRTILSTTEYRDYKLNTISGYKLHRFVEDNPVIIRKFELSVDTGDRDITLSKMIIERSELSTGNLIKYSGGLCKFDDRFFEDEWLEDFNEKVDTYSEKDLFLIISTIASYIYKTSMDLWSGYKVDPFVLEYISSVAIEAARVYIDLYPAVEGENKFDGWYHMWELYFTDSVLEEYLKYKNKSKEKS